MESKRSWKVTLTATMVKEQLSFARIPVIGGTGRIVNFAPNADLKRYVIFDSHRAAPMGSGVAVKQLYLAMPNPGDNWASDCRTDNFHTGLWEVLLFASLREQGLLVTQDCPSPDFHVFNRKGAEAWKSGDWQPSGSLRSRQRGAPRAATRPARAHVGSRGGPPRQSLEEQDGQGRYAQEVLGQGERLLSVPVMQAFARAFRTCGGRSRLRVCALTLAPRETRNSTIAGSAAGARALAREIR